MLTRPTIMAESTKGAKHRFNIGEIGNRGGLKLPLFVAVFGGHVIFLYTLYILYTLFFFPFCLIEKTNRRSFVPHEEVGGASPRPAQSDL